jgi:hypothetical protein
MLITWRSFGRRDGVGEVGVREIDAGGRRLKATAALQVRLSQRCEGAPWDRGRFG